MGGFTTCTKTGSIGSDDIIFRNYMILLRYFKKLKAIKFKIYCKIQNTVVDQVEMIVEKGVRQQINMN